MVVVLVVPPRKPTNTSKCLVCKKERPERAVKEQDPFCSNICCREYYNNPLPMRFWSDIHNLPMNKVTSK